MSLDEKICCLQEGTRRLEDRTASGMAANVCNIADILQQVITFLAARSLIWCLPINFLLGCYFPKMGISSTYVDIGRLPEIGKLVQPQHRKCSYRNSLITAGLESIRFGMGLGRICKLVPISNLVVDTCFDYPYRPAASQNGAGYRHAVARRSILMRSKGESH